MLVEASRNVTAHAQKPGFVFQRNGRVHLNRRGRQFSRLLAAEVCASAVVMLDTPYSEVVWRVLATHFVRQFPLHFPFRASPCAITFQQLASIILSACVDTNRQRCSLQICILTYLFVHFLYYSSSCAVIKMQDGWNKPQFTITHHHLRIWTCHTAYCVLQQVQSSPMAPSGHAHTLHTTN
jgi:hypothetical protein